MKHIRLIIFVFATFKLYSQEDKVYQLLNKYLNDSKIDTNIVSALKKDSAFSYVHFYSKSTTLTLESNSFILKIKSDKEDADTISIVFSYSSITNNRFDNLPSFDFTFSEMKEKQAKEKFKQLDKLMTKIAKRKWQDNKKEIRYLLPRSDFPTPQSVYITYEHLIYYGGQYRVSVQFVD